MTKDDLRAALAAIDREMKAAETAAAPARATLRPFQDAIDEIAERREIMLDDNRESYAGTCEGCAKILFEGELGCIDSEDGIYFCEECSPTLGEALHNNLVAKGSDDDEDLEQSIAYLHSRIAKEGEDTKLVYPL